MSQADINYKATFTLEQTGIDGEVISTLKFDPLPENAEDRVMAYDFMAGLAQVYLHEIGVIDEEGNLIDEDEFHSTVNLDVSDQVARRLN